MYICPGSQEHVTLRGQLANTAPLTHACVRANDRRGRLFQLIRLLILVMILSLIVVIRPRTQAHSGRGTGSDSPSIIVHASSRPCQLFYSRYATAYPHPYRSFSGVEDTPLSLLLETFSPLNGRRLPSVHSYVQLVHLSSRAMNYSSKTSLDALVRVCTALLWQPVCAHARCVDKPRPYSLALLYACSRYSTSWQDRT